jgi:hypothetical protein
VPKWAEMALIWTLFGIFRHFLALFGVFWRVLGRFEGLKSIFKGFKRFFDGFEVFLSRKWRVLGFFRRVLVFFSSFDDMKKPKKSNQKNKMCGKKNGKTGFVYRFFLQFFIF